MSERPENGVERDLRELLGDDAGLMQTARELREHLRPSDVDPDFRQRLRAQAVAERTRLMEERSRPWWQRLLGALRAQPGFRFPTAAALALAAVLAVLAGVFAVPRLQSRPPVPVAMSSRLAGFNAVSPSTPLTLHFDRPVDRGTVPGALRFAPATIVRSHWQGDNLVVTALHGWIPNAAYVVTLDASKARAANSAPLAGDARLAFGTTPLTPAGGAPGTAQSVAAAFVAAQIRGEAATMRSLSASGVDVDGLPTATRASITQVSPEPDGGALVNARLTSDGTLSHPLAGVRDEMLRLAPGGGSRGFSVSSITVGPERAQKQGPHVVHVVPGSRPGTIEVTYDCDMDPASVPGTNLATTDSGSKVPVQTSYEPATRTVTVTLPPGTSGPLHLTVTEGLRDVTGQHLVMALHTTVTLP